MIVLDDSSKEITIILADDHVILREGLKSLLQEYDEIEVVDEAANGVEAVQKVKEKQPDVLILDLIMPEMGGVEVLEALSAENIRTKTIVLTGADDDELLTRCVRSGAVGYMLKDTASSQLIDAIHTVHSGGCWLPADLTEKLIRNISKKPQSDDNARLSLLTAREMEVFKLLSEGKSNPEVAVELFISEHTVKVHVSRILDKLGLSSRGEAMRLAIRVGMIKA